MAGLQADPARTGCRCHSVCVLTGRFSHVLFSFLMILSLELCGLDMTVFQEYIV